MSATTPERVQLRVKRLRAEGQSFAAIARAVGIGETTVNEICRRAGMGAVPRAAVDPALIARGRLLWDAGAPLKRIAAALGLTEDRMGRIGRHAGWPPRVRPVAVPKRAVRVVCRAPTRIAAPPCSAPECRRPAPGRRCLWPLGEPRAADFRFCDAVVEVSGSYCNAHRAIAYTGLPRRVAA